MDRSELPRYSFVVERYKVVYVPIAKASTTSMKWLIATLSGEREENFLGLISAGSTRAATIHSRSTWRVTPQLDKMPPEKLREISPEAGWFVFAVTRHPTSRLWSAWQSKFLLRQDQFMRQYRELDWLPRIPASSSEVVEDFQRFAVAFHGADREVLISNRHFQTQSAILGRMPYSRLYTTAEVPQLLKDLGGHVQNNGGPDLPDLVLSNDTPLPLIEPLLTPDVLAAVESIYGDDLSRLGFPDVRPHGVVAAEEFTSAQVREVGRLVARNERISDLARKAAKLHKELARMRKAQRRSERASGGQS